MIEDNLEDNIDKFCFELDEFFISKQSLLRPSQIASLLISKGCDIIFHLKHPDTKESIPLQDCREIIQDSAEAAYQDFLHYQQEEIEDD